MPRRYFRALALSAVAGLVITSAGVAAAEPNPPDGANPLPNRSAVQDELPNPLEAKQRALRDEAVKLVLTGQRKVERINGVDVVRVGKKPAALTPAERRRVQAGQRVPRRTIDQYVRLSREQTDKIFVVLTEFGSERESRFPDKDMNPQIPGPATFEGPLHNAIPAPNRAVDNRTIWQPDYSAEHYRNLYFGTGPGVQSLKTYYQKQSSGRYSVEGLVTDWVKVRYNEARYGRSDDTPNDANGNDPAVCASNVCSNTWNLLDDGLDQWVADQKAAGQTDAGIKTALTSYDQQDRYDYDGDGDFREPDGYIDHFQIVHSGGDQADGDLYQGEDAIWSHRWRAFQGGEQGTGPANLPIGGTQIGNTGLWVADYTIQPENGGLSVFAHEYGHDLGLPDHYDTNDGSDNAVNWWTLMAQSRVKARGDVGIGTRPADLGVWDKLQLGWLDYEIAVAGQNKTFELGPHEYNSRKAQAVSVVLPDKKVTFDVIPPASGTKQWWSDTGDNLTNTLTRQVALPAGAAQLNFKAAYDIEDCGDDPCDYAYVEVNDGTGFRPIAGSITKTAEGNGIDGSTAGAYVPATFDLSAFAGKTVQLRFRYSTDGAVAGNDDDPAPNGFFVDDIVVTAGTTTVFSDDVEGAMTGWTANGFRVVGSTATDLFDNFYLASYRTYLSYDRYLKSGPYNFGFPARPRTAEFFPYQTGLLVNYWDSSYGDNNESEHPGQGLVLPIDSHPEPIYNVEGVPWRGRIQTYDAPFSLRKADSFTLHVNGKPSYIRGAAAQPLFDDTRNYWNAALPNVGVKTPKVGVTMRVIRQTDSAMTVRLGTSNPVSAAATLKSARSGN